jgi:MoaA/NifB/PqqE/SkfB family radical SAM enzyme
MLRNNLNLPVLKAEWIMNSPCQLSCSYCATAHRPIKELSLKDKIKVLKKFKEFDIFPVIYGGEVTLSPDFENVLKELSKLDIEYAIISNGLVNLQKLYKWAVVYNLPNWSVSIDTLDFESEYYDKNTLLKSRAGWATLVFTENLIADRVANITVTKHNIHEIPTIVEKLNSIGVWSLFNLVNQKKEGFVFSSDKANNLVPSQAEIEKAVLNIKRMITEGYLIHDPPETFDMWVQNGVKGNWHCSRLSKIVIDCDGTLQCCVDWKGEKYSKLSFLDLTKDNFSEFENLFLRDIWKCSGCAWSSTKTAEVFQEATAGDFLLKHV